MDKVILKKEIEAITSTTDSTEIIRRLKEKFNDTVDAEEIEKALIELKLEKRTMVGWVLMAIGSIIGFFSMVLTVMEVMPEWRNFIMYGLTTIAILIAFAGCYFVFEKN